MADDDIRNAVMQAFPLKPARTPVKTNPTQSETISEAYDESKIKVEYDKPNVEIPEKLLTKKTGLDLLGEALQHRIEIEEESEDTGLDEVRNKANEVIDRNLIRDMLLG